MIHRFFKQKPRLFFCISAIFLMFSSLYAQDDRPNPIQVQFCAEYAFVSFFPHKDDGNDWLTQQSVNFETNLQNGNFFNFSARILADGSHTELSPDGLIDVLAISFTPNSYLSLGAGKQNLKWGTARAFSSITKLAPPIDPTNTQFVSRSITGLRFDIIPTWFLSLSGVILPALEQGRKLEQITYAGRTEILIDEADICLGLISQTNQKEKRELTAIADFAYFFDFFGFYGEGQYVLFGNADTRLTAGTHIDIPAWLNRTIIISSEYQWFAEHQHSKYRLWLSLSGVPILHDLLASISTLISLDDSLIVYQSSLRWLYSQNIETSILVSHRSNANKTSRNYWGLNRSEISLKLSAFF